MKKFEPVPVSNISPQTYQKIIGRIVPAGNRTQYLYTPYSGRPCVYFRILIEEEYLKTEHYTERRGDREIRKTRQVRRWRQIVDTEQSIDFYIQDGATKCFVHAANRRSVKIEAEWDTNEQSGGMFDQQPPPGVVALLGYRVNAQYMNAFSLMLTGNGRTGRMRYKESSFDVNELVAAMGVSCPATDPYSGQPVYALFPPDQSMMSEKAMDQMGWSNWDNLSWKDTQKTPSVLISDKKKFSDGVMVQPLMDMPVYMIQTPIAIPMEIYQAPTAQPLAVHILPVGTVVPTALAGNYGYAPAGQDMDRGGGGVYAPSMPMDQAIPMEQSVPPMQTPAAPPMQAPTQEVAALSGPPKFDPATGLPLEPPTQEVVALSGPPKFDPATGLPLEPPTQEVVALPGPPKFDPATGLPLGPHVFDPATGAPLNRAANIMRGQ